MTLNSNVLEKLKDEPHGLQLSPDVLKSVFSRPNESDLLLRSKEFKGIVLDFGSLFPGDFQGESFINEALSSLGWFIKKLVYSSLELQLEVLISFTKASQGELLKNLLGDKGVLFEHRNLSLSHLVEWHQRKLLALGVNDILRILEELKGIESRRGGLSLISLWGNIEKVGSHWVSNHSSLNEIYELNAGGETRLSYVLIDGPAGRLLPWQEAKEMTLFEASSTPRTMHFLSDLTDKEFIKTWNEFFYQDQCRKCLPCEMARHQMKGEKLCSSFKGSASSLYQCNLPELYRRGSRLVESFSMSEALT